MNEEWRPIAGFIGYEVSSLGNIRSYWRRGRIRKMRSEPGLMTPQPRAGDPFGYYRIKLYAEDRYKVTPIHLLVVGAFIGEPPAGMTINHKDGNKHNNSVDNLEFMSPRENVRHAIALGLRNHKGIKKIPPAEKEEILAMRAQGMTQQQIADALNRPVNSVRSVISRQAV